MLFSCLTNVPGFLHFLKSVVSSCLSLIFGIRGRPRRAKASSRNKKQGHASRRVPQGPAQFQNWLIWNI